jgi:hypothetical protein
MVADRIQQIREDGISVVLSTHDLAFDARIADRICVMIDGNVAGCGTPPEVFYDEALLEEANLHPPGAVRVARDAGLDTSAQPVTEADLVALLSDARVTRYRSGVTRSACQPVKPPELIPGVEHTHARPYRTRPVSSRTGGRSRDRRTNGDTGTDNRNRRSSHSRRATSWGGR